MVVGLKRQIKINLADSSIFNSCISICLFSSLPHSQEDTSVNILGKHEFQGHSFIV